MTDEMTKLADEPFTKLLRIFQNWVSVKNHFCGKLVSSLELPVKFDEKFKVTSVPYFIEDFNSLICELENFTLNVLYWVILYQYYIKTK